jgi:hypothetical protein
MMIAFAVVALWIGAAVLPFVILGRRWQWRWQEVETGDAPADAASILYREGGRVPTYLRQAPPLIRVAAFTCMLLGELFIPYLVVATMGLFVFGLGMLLVPILITAAKLYRAGFLLLRREPRSAYFAARNAAWWSLWCTGFGLLACMIVVYYSFSWAFVAAAVPIALLIAGQALLILRATEKYEDALFANSRMVRLGDHWVPTDAAA